MTFRELMKRRHKRVIAVMVGLMAVVVALEAVPEVWWREQCGIDCSGRISAIRL